MPTSTVFPVGSTIGQTLGGLPTLGPVKSIAVVATSPVVLIDRIADARGFLLTETLAFDENGIHRSCVVDVQVTITGPDGISYHPMLSAFLVLDSPEPEGWSADAIGWNSHLTLFADAFHRPGTHRVDVRYYVHPPGEYAPDNSGEVDQSSVDSDDEPTPYLIDPRNYESYLSVWDVRVVAVGHDCSR